MGVEINIRDQRTFNEFKNGYSFANNPAESTYNLTGSVMENIRVYTLIEVGWFSKTKDNAATWTVNTSNGTLQSNSGNFVTDGFAVGDEFYYEEISGGGGVNFTARITSVSATNINFLLLTGSRANTDTDAIIRGVTPLTASIFKFNLLGNTENFNVESKVSENDQGYYASNIGFDTGGGVRDTNFVLMNRLGQYADWDTGVISIRFVADSYNPASAQRGFQLFEIYHNVTITPYYLEGELTNLQNNIIPPLLNGLNSLKYAYSPGFRTVLSNPNTEKIQVMDVLKGSVAWFNENFNGFNNYYGIKSVQYQDANTLTNADGLLVAGKTRVTILVEDLNGSYAGGERYGVYVSYLPEQSEYQNTVLTNLKDNFIYDRVVQSEGQPPVLGADFISNCFATVVSGDLEIVFEKQDVDKGLIYYLACPDDSYENYRPFDIALQSCFSAAFRRKKH